MRYPDSLEKLVAELAKLPGIGPKTAHRLAFSLIFRENAMLSLSEALVQAHHSITTCSQCFGLSEGELCNICSSKSRNKEVVCVVEEARNIFTIEASGFFDGYYHVLQGTISPMDGIGPEQLRIHELEERLKKQPVKELILATNPTAEGEVTAHYLTDHFKKQVPSITRLATGMPSGGDMEYADSNTLVRAFEGRTFYSKT